jgi:alpha-L-arabinofuranosidase
MEAGMSRIVVEADRGERRISRHIYGHFAEHLGRCIYEGIWVGEGSPIPNTGGIRKDVAGALAKLRMPNLRWPGGCFADTYHWRDGVGPREARPSIVNVHWGGVTENNHFGTHEFFELCALLGAEPYICGNVGSGTVREMSEWLEYITMPGRSPMADLRRAHGRESPWDITYWAVGNENWGCGGAMTATQYAWEYRRYQCYCRHLGGRKLYRVACGHEDAWNETLMREAVGQMDGLSVHYYCHADSWRRKGPATGFPVAEWYSLLKSAIGIDDFVKRTATIMDRYDPAGRVGMVVDEWGTWHDVEPGTDPGFLYQQNTVRDAVAACLSLNILNHHSDRVHMANIAQTVNVLQAMVLTDGPRMLLTPTYHVFEMLKVHQDAAYLPIHVQDEGFVTEGGKLPRVSASASRDPAGKVHVSLCNLHHEEEAEVSIELRGDSRAAVAGRLLAGPAMDSHNDFEHPDAVKPVPFDGIRLARGVATLRLPARSVAVVELA